MSRFQHHPDGEIYIGDYAFPLIWWLTQEPSYSGLPEGAIGRLYIPKKRHHLTIIKNDAPYQSDGGLNNENLWPEGDGYISKLQDYIDAYDLYLNPPLSLEQIKKIKINELTTIFNASLDFGFESDALGTTHRYDNEKHNRENILDVVLSGVDREITCDNLSGDAGTSKARRIHTVAQSQQLLKDSGEFKDDLINSLKSKIKKVTSATDEDSVKAIT